MSNFENIFGDYFNAYQQTSKFKDNVMLEISLRKHEFEQNLDEMWAIYGKGVVSQIVEYNKGVEYLKSNGYKVLRNSDGKHKIVLKR